jgi:hypothetical protein
MARFEVPDGWTAQAYRFALDPRPSQVRTLESHCGASRSVFNHMLNVVKNSLDQRAAERSYGLSEAELTPAGMVVAQTAPNLEPHQERYGAMVGGQQQGGLQLGSGRVGPCAGEVVEVSAR